MNKHQNPESAPGHEEGNRAEDEAGEVTNTESPEKQNVFSFTTGQQVEKPEDLPVSEHELEEQRLTREIERVNGETEELVRERNAMQSELNSLSVKLREQAQANQEVLNYTAQINALEKRYKSLEVKYNPHLSRVMRPLVEKFSRRQAGRRELEKQIQAFKKKHDEVFETKRKEDIVLPSGEIKRVTVDIFGLQQTLKRLRSSVRAHNILIQGKLEEKKNLTNALTNLHKSGR